MVGQADVLARIQALAKEDSVRISEHGYNELANDGLTARETVAGVEQAVVVESYPDFPKGPSVLARQRDAEGRFVHVVWGVPKDHNRPAVLITAYRPDPKRWTQDKLKRL